jgi:hypothetical protein
MVNTPISVFLGSVIVTAIVKDIRVVVCIVALQAIASVAIIVEIIVHYHLTVLVVINSLCFAKGVLAGFTL